MPEEFKKTVWNHYRTFGRDLPWRKNITPYRIVVSEIMLQQTQVDRVILKYQAWMKQFPSWKALASAPISEVLSAWQGLGYNRRALNLKKLAEVVTTHYRGRLPADPTKLRELPGIGPATTGSILAFAFNRPHIFIETNIRRVYLHHFFADQKDIDDKALLPFLEKTLDQENPREWYWALMDYGSHLAKQVLNPNRRSRHYAKQSAFAGSHRQLRGAILRALIPSPNVGEGGVRYNENQRQALTIPQLSSLLAQPRHKIRAVASELESEGFLICTGQKLALKDN